MSRTKIIALLNHKGGVGKTTSTLNLGKALSLKNKKVLIIDIDPQANLSQSVGIEDPDKSIFDVLFDTDSKPPVVKIDENFDILPASLELSEAESKLITDVNGYFKLKELVSGLAKSYDYILIDCPPSLGILTINALIAANEVIIVVLSQYLAIKGLNTITGLIKELKKNLNPELIISGLLLTQVNRTVTSKMVVEKIQEEYKKKVFNTTIQQNVKITEASIVHKDIFTYDNTCVAAENYASLADEIDK